MIRDFFTKRSKRMILARFIVFTPIGLGMVLFFDVYFDKKEAERRRVLEAEWQQEKSEVKAEAQHRHAASKTETLESQKEFTDEVSTADMKPEPPATETHEHVEVVAEGPLKGMIVEDAKAFARQHLADAKAEATKRHQWELRRRELYQRRLKNIEKQVALALASTESVDAELQAMLSVFKLMSDEQREYLRQELLKTKPADEVNDFFQDVSRAPTKTVEQLDQDATEFLKSREVYKAARREVAIEREQILMEIKEHERAKPF